MNDAFVDWVTLQAISSKPLATQTISGTVDFGAMMKSSVTGATFSAFRVWVAKPDGTARGSDSCFIHTNSNTIGSNGYISEFRSAVALTSNTTVTAGDYLVIEIGVYVTNSSSKTIGLKVGDPTANSNVVDDTSTTSRVANCVFSDDILFVNPPTGVTYAASQGNSVQAEKGVAITTNTPAYSGGENDTETFTISAGALPPGISISSSTGALTGTPTTDGDYNFTVQVANVAGSSTVNMLYQIYTGATPPPEDPTPVEDPPEFLGVTTRTRNAIYVVDTGTISVDNPKPILLGLMITASADTCRIIIKESSNGIVVLDTRIEANETRQLDFSHFGGIHLSQTFEIFMMEDVGCAILYGIWGKALG